MITQSADPQEGLLYPSFALYNGKWSQPDGLGTPVEITYSFDNLLDGQLGGDLTSVQLKDSIEEALSLWSNYAPLNFTQVGSNGEIVFRHQGIDGSNNILGRALTKSINSITVSSDIKFDTDENWSLDPNNGIDFLEVAVHEIGHALGLDHTDITQAIMYPIYGGRYSGLTTSFLNEDDINGIQAHYGEGMGSLITVDSFPPITKDDFFVTPTNTNLNGNVLIDNGNGIDYDPDGDSLTVAIAVNPTNGTLTNFDDQGHFTYLPNLDFTGEDTFVYTLIDENGDSASATVTIAVGINYAPSANNDNYQAEINRTLTGNVLSNDSDINLDTLKAVLDTDVSHGHLTLNLDGTFSYTPNQDYLGNDSFTYYANDGELNSDNPATVSITVTPVQYPPVANDDYYEAEKGTIITGNVLDNDTDANGDSLTAKFISESFLLPGRLSFNNNGNFSYTPDPNYVGSGSFTYYANDGQFDSEIATIFITINPPTTNHDAPIANDDYYEGEKGNTITGNILDNDTDADGDSLTAHIIPESYQLNGNLSFENNGNFSFTPNAGYVGTGSFQYYASDGQFDSEIATVFITVNDVNQTPDLVSQSFNVVSDHVLGGEVTVDFTITNQGLGNAESFNLQFVYSDDNIIGNDDDMVVDTLTVEQLLSGDNYTNSHTLQLSLASLNSRAINDDPPNMGNGYISNSYDYLGIIIDPEDQIMESDELNNVNQGKGIDKDDITYFPWDLDNNGVVTSTDAIFVINRIGQTMTQDNHFADLNGDEVISSTDAISIINRIGYQINPNVMEDESMSEAILPTTVDI